MKGCEHDYMLIGGQYSKRSGKITNMGTSIYDQSVAYSMVFCRKCAQTKEIVSADHRRLNTKP